MSQKKVKKVVGEGGAHGHRLESPTRTFRDGVHKHLFFVNERLIMTELDGGHWHPVNATKNEVGNEAVPKHRHSIQLNTQLGVKNFQTEQGTPHPHELQVEGTTLSGLHTHTFSIEDNSFVSLLPGDLISEIKLALKNNPQLKNFKIKYDPENPLELDFATVKRLNKKDFRKVMIEAVPKALIKSLTRLSDGMRIQSLVLSRERFVDLGEARRFVMDHGLQVRGSSERDKSFMFDVLSGDKFQEATLQRVRLTEGVEAIVGFLREEVQLDTPVEDESLDTSAADSLTENATESTRTNETRTDTLDSLEDNMENLKSKLAKLEDNYKEETLELFVPIYKQDDEKRLVMGPLLIPETVDLQDDIISADEIEKAAHNYMIKLTFQNDPEFLKEVGLNDRSDRGFMHVEFSRKIALVESFLAPVDFELNNRAVKKGTWIVTVKVFDDEIWNLVKAGKITGFSIGGRSRVIEESTEE